LPGICAFATLLLDCHNCSDKLKDETHSPNHLFNITLKADFPEIFLGPITIILVRKQHEKNAAFKSI
jgi:hypothetical protein